MNYRIRWLLEILVAFLLGPLVARSAGLPTEGTAADWSLVCEEGDADASAPPCELVQIVRHAGDKEPVLRLSLASAAFTSFSALHLILPPDTHETTLAVVRLSDGRDVVRVPIAQCTRKECTAEALLPLPAVDAFAHARGCVLILAGTSGKVHTIPLSAHGLAELLPQMAERNRGWKPAGQDRADVGSRDAR